MISIKNIHKFYNKGKKNEIHAINDVSLELPEKGIVALYGKSGCGKTTLLNIIGGLLKVDEGDVLIYDQSISKNTDLIRNKYIGYIFQNYYLNKSETVYENIADALRIMGICNSNEIDYRVMTLLKKVGMEKYSNRLPETLSGGQQQRVAIARAIVKNPEIILADEPTGNLDEKNTIAIMELLKEIGKEHLVLLVTHESRLVDYYCDMVINVLDGSVSNIKKNLEVSDLKIYDSNIIYLGEMEKHEINSDIGVISYYGELKKDLISLDIINYQGNLYLRVNSKQLKFLEENSEIILRDGCSHEKVNEDIDKSQEKIEILPIQKNNLKKMGKLFNWKNSFGYAWKNISDGTRGNRLLHKSLFLFAAILVLLTAFYGTVIKDVLDIKNANNNNSFYAYIPNEAKARELLQAVNSEKSCIDSVQFSNQIIMGDQSFYIQLPKFESSINEMEDNSSVIQFHGTIFPEKLSDDLRLIKGSEKIIDNEALITTAVADMILDNSKNSLFCSYDSLIGFTAISNMGTETFKIGGIVQSEENAIYLGDNFLAKKRYGESFNVLITTGESYDTSVNKGNVVLRVNNNQLDEKPSIGEEVLINGNSLIISDVINSSYTYEDWLKDNEIWKKDEDETDYLEFDYLDYYYADYADYVLYCKNNKNLVDYNRYMELICSGSKEAWYVSVMELCQRYDYYWAYCFKKDNGHYPNKSELEEMIYVYDDPYTIVNELLEKVDASDTYNYVYILSEEDYIRCSKSFGKSSGYGIQLVDENDAYVVIHSTNAKTTEKYLSQTFSNVNVPISAIKPYTTPRMLYDEKIEEYRGKVYGSFAIWLILVIVLCLCVYMIMRGNMMRRIGEIGIYRCLGVTCKNIIFRFLIEEFVTVGTSTCVGYLITSIFLWIINGSGYKYILNSIIFYPIWLGIILFLFIALFSVVFGLLPIIILLRKTPSEIMAMYDI